MQQKRAPLFLSLVLVFSALLLSTVVFFSLTQPVNAQTAPACDANQLEMTSIPTSIAVGEALTIRLNGNQGSTWVNDTFSPGNVLRCDNFPITAWPRSASCTGVAAGTVTWTHAWKNCAPGNCDTQSSVCSKQLSITVTPLSPPTATLRKTSGILTERTFATTVGTPIPAQTFTATLHAGAGTTISDSSLILVKVDEQTGLPLFPGVGENQTAYGCTSPNIPLDVITYTGNQAKFNGRYCFVQISSVRSGTQGELKSNAWTPTEPGRYVLIVDVIGRTPNGSMIKCGGSPFGTPDTTHACDPVKPQGIDQGFLTLIVNPQAASPTPTRPVTTTPTTIPQIAADVNQDGCISTVDFNEWLWAFVNNGVPKNQRFKPDVNQDGSVNTLDFNLWLRSFIAGDYVCR